MNLLARWILLVVIALTGLSAVAQDRVIRPNDKVKVVCEEEPALNRDYTVTSDGFILMSFIGAVKVSGLSEKAAADRIVEELLRQRILRRATVTVTLLANETLPVRFSGAVGTPGQMPWKEGLRLSDVAGFAKPLATADLERVRIESRLGQIATVNFRRHTGENDAFNPLIQPGDFVFFPLTTRETKAFILGAVLRPGAVEVTTGMTLNQAIQKAGGVVPQANPDRVRFTREGQPEQIISLRTDAGEMPLQPGDRFVIEAIARDRVIVVMGGVKSPGSIGFTEGLTLTRALAIAGGVTDSARVTKVKLTRRQGERTTTRDVDLKRIQEGFIGDVVLQPGDRIDVPQMGRRRNNADLLPIALVVFFLFGR